MEGEKVRKKWTKKRVKTRTGPPARVGMECQTITTGSGRYVQRYARCGVGCSVCTEGAPNWNKSQPGHGPYWYFERVVKGKRVRRYCGNGPMPRGFGELAMNGLDNPTTYPDVPVAVEPEVAHGTA